MARFTICILTHNRLDDVQRCFESLMPTLLREDVSVWVLDNASTDGTAEYVQGLTFQRIMSAVNLGVAGGRAELLKCATGERIVFLDSDTVIVDRDWLDDLDRVLDNEAVGVVGPYGSFVKPDWSGFMAGRPGEVDTVAGACQMWRGDLFKWGVEIPQELAKFWHEDAWSCLMARELGFDVICAPCGVEHYPAHSGYGQEPGLHDENFAKFRARWQGKQIVKCEGGY